MVLRSPSLESSSLLQHALGHILCIDPFSDQSSVLHWINRQIDDATGGEPTPSDAPGRTKMFSSQKADGMRQGWL